MNKIKKKSFNNILSITLRRQGWRKYSGSLMCLECQTQRRNYEFEKESQRDEFPFRNHLTQRRIELRTIGLEAFSSGNDCSFVKASITYCSIMLERCEFPFQIIC